MPVTSKSPTFKVGQAVVYPSHGVGRIDQIIVQEIAGFEMSLFVIGFEQEKLQIKVPVNKASSVGMRPVSTSTEIDAALKVLQGRVRTGRGIWSRRAQELEGKINSGSLVSMAEVVRDLHRVETQPSASFSERQLYETAFARMSKEVAAARDITLTEAFRLLDATLKAAPKRAAKEEEVEAEDVHEAA